MATTTMIGTDLELKHRLDGEYKPSQHMSGEAMVAAAPQNDKDGYSTKPTPLRANVAATREAATKSKDDPYGFKSRKKTVCSTWQNCHRILLTKIAGS